jgi:methionyl-tRNA synthetase
MKTISFDTWQDLDIRTGEVLEAEPLEDTQALFKLKVDLGTETRTIVAGLKKYYSKEELEGKRCIVLCNLEPKKIRGIESKGMLLAALNGDKSEVKLLQTDGAIDSGCKIS